MELFLFVTVFVDFVDINRHVMWTLFPYELLSNWRKWICMREWVESKSSLLPSPLCLPPPSPTLLTFLLTHPSSHPRGNKNVQRKMVMSSITKTPLTTVFVFILKQGTVAKLLWCCTSDQVVSSGFEHKAGSLCLAIHVTLTVPLESRSMVVARGRGG